MVLGFVVDLSTLPYLLHPFPRSSQSGRPQSVGPSRLQLCQSEKSCKQRFGASPVGDAGQSEVALARPSGRRSGLESEASVVPPRPGLLVGEADQSQKRGLLVREAG